MHHHTRVRALALAAVAAALACRRPAPRAVLVPPPPPAPDDTTPLGYLTPECYLQGTSMYDVALRIGDGLDSAAAARGEGALVVRVRRLRQGDVLEAAQARLLSLRGPEARPTAAAQAPARGAGWMALGPVPAGDYRLEVRRIGYHFEGRVRVRAGGSDTLTVWLNPQGANTTDLGCTYPGP